MRVVSKFICNISITNSAVIFFENYQEKGSCLKIISVVIEMSQIKFTNYHEVQDLVNNINIVRNNMMLKEYSMCLTVNNWHEVCAGD